MLIVLASASPRRQELLRNAALEFVAKPANIPEIPLEHEAAREFAERMAREKARAVWNQGSEHKLTTKDTKLREGPQEQKDLYVIGADTVVVVQDQVLGKPENEEDAARILRLLSGREHQVITGVCLLGNDFEDVRSETTAVQFSALGESEINDYVRSGEPMDKAGAYAIQGMASKWISKVEGDYSNVVGLPVKLLLQMLREHGAIRS
ncbi:MAG TPA: Maf family protein [Terriglobales bacterium]|nr:Maf family protein [Terriglobales bacterium]